jgi:hypothetical protein
VLDQSQVQILVVVANTKESNFWAEVEKGFHRTIFDMKLVGPKEGGENHIKSMKRSNSYTLILRKGIILKSMNHCYDEMWQHF